MIDPRAMVSEQASIAPGVVVEAFARIDADVVVGAGTVIQSYSWLRGRTRIGRENRIGPYAAIGGPAQVRDPSAGHLQIGDNNRIGEYVSIHTGTAGGSTQVGNGCMLMAYAHVAHDCQLGDGVELANGVQLAGHVAVGQGAGLGGLAGVHQFSRIGRLAFVGAGAMVAQDVPPFALVCGDRARCFGINAVGLRRAGIDAVARKRLQRALRLVCQPSGEQRAIDELAELAASEGDPLLRELAQFVLLSERGVCRWVNRREARNH
ncbi:MAG: acyl-ACP--UDP-N-acetylglucosamine O-acyltransferase [Deltaproteobacteria bacterium]|nr:acyl-ACP--UDP-N-acetylglucosamine O-acyltransferase [Deltaproteobacteria bacterium]